MLREGAYSTRGARHAVCQSYSDLRAGDQQKPEYLKLNPNAVVPTIVHDGNVVIESNIILEYLAEVLPGPSLVTSSPLGRARMRYWTKQLDGSIHQLTSVISFAIGFRYQLLAKPREQALAVLQKIPDPFRRERQIDIYEKGVDSAFFAPAIRRFEKMLADMEKELTASSWLAGADYSLADIAFTPYVNGSSSFNSRRCGMNDLTLRSGLKPSAGGHHLPRPMMASWPRPCSR
jgi:glutathione S-transferase